MYCCSLGTFRVKFWLSSLSIENKVENLSFRCLVYMKFKETNLSGLWVIESELFEDQRGSFLKTFCAREFENHGLKLRTENCYLTHNFELGTLRGMHYQEEPYSEDKLVRCIAGKIFDVAIDIRLSSKTYQQWFGLELSPENRRALFISKGFA